VLKKYFDYNKWYRVHQSLEIDTPDRRKIQSERKDDIVDIPHFCLLHHNESKAALGLNTKADLISGRTVFLSGSGEPTFDTSLE